MEEARNKGGRPQGTTLKRKRTTNLAVIAATNEIASLYANEMHEVEIEKGVIVTYPCNSPEASSRSSPQ